jgi:SAM-dependent methyltransferase
MGLNTIGIRFLLYARDLGVDFSRTTTIGRQGMHLDTGSLRQSLENFGYRISADDVERLITENGFAEPFLRLLGATETVSFDASDYENASHVHDFNSPLEEEFTDRFSVVFDGGTLEHVFNFPQAISNCMKMVRPGGHFLGATPTNNFSGHGFYQFSPELFFRIFGPDNGFIMRSMQVSEEGVTDWYSVIDPINSQRETYLLVIARKTATVPLFSKPIQQSDYALLWRNHES